MRVGAGFRAGWRGGLVSAGRFAGRTPGRLIVAPTDLRAVDPFVAEEILEGRVPLAGRVLDTEGKSPFELDLPSLEFAVGSIRSAGSSHMRALTATIPASRGLRQTR